MGYANKVYSIGKQSMISKTTKSNQDSAWKDLLDMYLKECLEFFYPEIAKQIDWEAGYETLIAMMNRY